jgi:hypothetical protein
MSACLAMLTERPIIEVMDVFHNAYRDCTMTPQQFLQASGVTYIYEARQDDVPMGKLLEGYIYLLSVPSLAVKNKTHAIVLDLRTNEPLVYDPINKKRVFGVGSLDVRCWTIELIITSRTCDVL